MLYISNNSVKETKYYLELNIKLYFFLAVPSICASVYHELAIEGQAE